MPNKFTKPAKEARDNTEKKYFFIMSAFIVMRKAAQRNDFCEGRFFNFSSL